MGGKPAPSDVAAFGGGGISCVFSDPLIGEPRVIRPIDGAVLIMPLSKTAPTRTTR